MKKSTLILFLSIITNLTFGQENENRLNGIDQEIETLLKSYKAVGLSIAVVKNDKVIYSKAFGYRNLEEKLLTTENTVFPIGSATKAFTASLFGILESKDKISLKEKPSFYIPKLQFYNDKMDDLVKIEDLLSHKSGIGNQGTTLSLFPEKDKLKTVARLKFLKPEGEIKNSWYYSNMGYTLAGTIIEQITNETWDKNINEKIFKPLNMNNSTTELEVFQNSQNHSLGYGKFGENVETVMFENFYSYSPAGAIKSSSSDMANWILTWLNQGIFNDQQVLPENYIKNATTIQNIMPQDGADNTVYLFGDGFGWRVQSFKGHYKVNHGGNTSGFSSQVVMFPNDKLGIVVLTNQHNSILPYIVSDLITNRMLNLSKTEIEDYPIVVGDIYKPNSKENSINKEKLPTHNFESFIGKYYADGYGTIEVVSENKKLFVKFPTLTFKLEHLNFNTFYMESTEDFPQIMNPEFNIQFVDDTKGIISLLKLYSQNEPVEFIKE